MSEVPKTLNLAVRGLGNHMDELYEAVKHQHGLISTGGRESALKAMKKAGLIYVIDELDGYMVHGVVARLIKYFDDKGRLSQSNLDVARVLHKIEQSIELYRVVRKKGGDNEFAQDVAEGIWELADVLVMICHRFSVQVYEHMASIGDIEARIRFNEQQISELIKLNDVFGGQLSDDRLQELGLFYDEFGELTQKMLMPILDKCRRELVGASGRLNSELLKFKKELANKQTDTLIQAWRQHFRKNPNRRFDDSLLMTAPKAFFGASLPMIAYADVRFDDEIYATLVQKCTTKPPPNQNSQDVPIVVEVVNQTIDELISPVFERIEWFFEYVDKQGKLDAHTAFVRLSVVDYVDYEDWLLLLNRYHETHGGSFDKPIVVVFDSEPLAGYDGTQLVYNLTFKVGFEG